MGTINENHTKDSLPTRAQPLNMTLSKRSANVQTNDVELKQKNSSCCNLPENTNHSCCYTMQDACRLQSFAMPACLVSKPLNSTVSNYGNNAGNSPPCNFDMNEKQNCECCCCCCPSENKKKKKVSTFSNKSKGLIKELQTKQREIQNQMEEFKKILQLPHTGNNSLLGNKNNISPKENSQQPCFCCCFCCEPQNKPETQTSGPPDKKALIPEIDNQKFGEENDEATKKDVQKLLDVLLERHTDKKTNCGDGIELFMNKNVKKYAPYDPLTERLHGEETSKKKDTKPAKVESLPNVTAAKVPSSTAAKVPSSTAVEVPNKSVVETPTEASEKKNIVSKNVGQNQPENPKSLNVDSKKVEATTTKQTQTKKPVAKNVAQTPANKTKNTTAKNTTAKNTTAKNTTAKNTTAKNTTAKNTTAKNTTAKNTTVKNNTAGQNPPKKTANKNSKSQKPQVGSTKNNNRSIFESFNIFELDNPMRKQNYEIFKIYETQKNVGKRKKRRKTRDEKMNHKTKIDKKNSKNKKTKECNETKYVGIGRFESDSTEISVDDVNYNKDYKIPEKSYHKLKSFTKRKNLESLSKLPRKSYKSKTKNRKRKNNKNSDLMKRNIESDKFENKRSCDKRTKDVSCKLAEDVRRLIELIESYKKL